MNFGITVPEERVIAKTFFRSYPPGRVGKEVKEQTFAFVLEQFRKYKELNPTPLLFKTTLDEFSKALESAYLFQVINLNLFTEKEELVAVCLCNIETTSDAAYAFLSRLCVKESCRGKGIASGMISYIEERCNELSFSIIRSEVRNTIGMRTFFEKRGYKVFLLKENSTIMEKLLISPVKEKERA